MVWKASAINLTSKQREILLTTVNSRTGRQDHIQRAQIVLMSDQNLSNVDISKKLSLGKSAVSKWRRRWFNHQDVLQEIENSSIKAIDFKRYIESLLSDEARSGKPPKFTEEQIAQILAVASEKPEESELPLSHWSLSSLAIELQKRGIVESISTSQLSVFLKSSESKAA